MNITFINLSLIIEGATEKISQFVITLKSIRNKNVYFVEQKCIFENCEEAETFNNLKTYNSFVFKKLCVPL
jgi:hypothetical protein